MKKDSDTLQGRQYSETGKAYSIPSTGSGTTLDLSWLPATLTGKDAATVGGQTATALLNPTTASISPTRTFTTVYQNTTGKPMFVSCSVYSSNISIFYFYSDASNPPTTQTFQWSGAANQVVTATVVILPGNYYKITNNSGTPAVYWWSEWY